MSQLGIHCEPLCQVSDASAQALLAIHATVCRCRGSPGRVGYSEGRDLQFVDAEQAIQHQTLFNGGVAAARVYTAVVGPESNDQVIKIVLELQMPGS